MTLDLSLEELEELRGLLETTLPELGEEIYRTDAQPLRNHLKDKSETLRLLKAKIDKSLAEGEVTELQ